MKLSDELFERSKDDRAMIVGSEIRAAIQEQRNEIETLERQRDELLEALKPIMRYPGIREYIGSLLADRAEDAIKSVEGEK